jgi:hypothetical protein
MLPALKRRFDIIAFQRFFRGETVKSATPHKGDLIDQYITLGSDFARVAGFPQDARGRIAPAIAEYGKPNLDEREPVKKRDQLTGVFAIFEAHCSGVRLVKKAIERDGGFFMLFVIAKTQGINHKAPP